jgi:hypothetical protein
MKTRAGARGGMGEALRRSRREEISSTISSSEESSKSSRVGDSSGTRTRPGVVLWSWSGSKGVVTAITDESELDDERLLDLP